VGSASTSRVILSRLDGSLDVADIAALTGVSEQDVEATLGPLVQAGLVSLGDVVTPSPAPATAAKMSMVPPGISVDGRRASGEMQAVEPLTQLTDEEQHRISDLYARLNKIDHYRLLGVAATADAKDIKRSYYALAKLYHPDRFFRKDVGSLRAKIQAIFSAMTTAMEALTDASRRQAYDAYLRDVLMTRIARRNAEALEQKREFAAAAEVWERVVEQLPMDAYVQHRHAYALLRGRVRESFNVAIAAATRAIELDPTRAEYRITAACLYLAAERDRSALAEIEVAWELEPDRMDVAGLHAAVSERVYGPRG
jgi:tetratricopeptide (TPR) repeat protein